MSSSLLSPADSASLVCLLSFDLKWSQHSGVLSALFPVPTFRVLSALFPAAYILIDLRDGYKKEGSGFLQSLEAL